MPPAAPPPTWWTKHRADVASLGIAAAFIVLIGLVLTGVVAVVLALSARRCA